MYDINMIDGKCFECKFSILKVEGGVEGGTVNVFGNKSYTGNE